MNRFWRWEASGIPWRSWCLTAACRSRPTISSAYNMAVVVRRAAFVRLVALGQTRAALAASTSRSGRRRDIGHRRLDRAHPMGLHHGWSSPSPMLFGFGLPAQRRLRRRAAAQSFIVTLHGKSSPASPSLVITGAPDPAARRCSPCSRARSLGCQCRSRSSSRTLILDLDAAPRPGSAKHLRGRRQSRCGGAGGIRSGWVEFFCFRAGRHVRRFAALAGILFTKPRWMPASPR